MQLVPSKLEGDREEPGTEILDQPMGNLECQDERDALKEEVREPCGLLHGSS